MTVHRATLEILRHVVIISYVASSLSAHALSSYIPTLTLLRPACLIPLAQKMLTVQTEMSGDVNHYRPAAYLQARVIATSRAHPQNLPSLLPSHGSN